MCRWNAYFGQPLLVEELLFKTQHGLIDQSMHARMGVETTNGNGFGSGWESTAMLIQTGADETRSFQPHWP